jgi:hypothetical protein
MLKIFESTVLREMFGEKSRKMEREHNVTPK